MAETPEITPALTPEEWAKAPWKRHGIADWLELPGDEDRHGVAALALYGMPFGFTKEDALLCVGLAKWLVSGGGDAELRAAGIHSFNAAPAEALVRLASRIASLLPPEP